MSRPGLRRTLAARGQTALRAYVLGAGDRRLERTFGSSPALRLLFREAESAFRPERAEGFRGDVACELRRLDGTVRTWTLALDEIRARARQGGSANPQLTIRVGLADLVRIAAGELDPDTAVLTGRLDLVGDFALAMRLGAMFGR